MIAQYATREQEEVGLCLEAGAGVSVIRPLVIHSIGIFRRKFIVAL